MQRQKWHQLFPSFLQCSMREKWTHARPDACQSQHFRRMSLHCQCLRAMDVFQCIQHQKQPSIPHVTAEMALIISLIFTMWHA